MKGHLFERKQRFSIRKFSVGVCSAHWVSIFREQALSLADETVSTSVEQLPCASFSKDRRC